MDELADKIIWTCLFRIAILYAIKIGMEKLADFMKTLWIEGLPNEWVIIMRNGKMVKAGIGLKTFKGPFDQVAKFPSRTHRVEFSTESITKEM